MRSSLRLAVVTLSLAAAGLPDVHAGDAREMKTIVDASSGVTRIFFICAMTNYFNFFITG